MLPWTCNNWDLDLQTNVRGLATCQSTAEATNEICV